MFPARQQIIADLLTAPAVVVVGIGTAFGDLVLAAKAGLRRSHELTRRAWAGVTLRVARVRTGRARLGASLATGVWRQARDVGWVDVFAAPAVVGIRLFRQG